MSNIPTYQLRLLLILALIGATLGAYWQVQHNDFINFDDPKYILENHHVQAKLTLKSITRAFTATHVSNWHPLTWLSHMLDYQIYGLNPGGHHLPAVDGQVGKSCERLLRRLLHVA